MQFIRPISDRRSFLKYTLSGYAAVKAGAASTTASGATSASSAARYNDVKAGDWFYDAVNFVADRGLIDGSGMNFNPVDNADRATVTTALYRIAGSPSVEYSKIFNDVPTGRWYSDAVIWADETGVVDGSGDGRFGPDDAVSRQQFAAMLLRAARIKFPETTDLDGFTDNGDVSEYARTAMGWCVKRGLVAETAAAALEPNNSLSRAQCAAILQRFVNLRENPLNIWAVNPRSTKPDVLTPGMAHRVTGGWAGKTIVIMDNYNAHVPNYFAEPLEKTIKTTLRQGETVKFVYMGDLTVIRYQVTAPSRVNREGWENTTYQDFITRVEAGTIKPDAVIVAGGF